MQNAYQSDPSIRSDGEHLAGRAVRAGDGPLAEAQSLLKRPGHVSAPAVAGAAPAAHTISLSNAYGELVESEEVPAAEFQAALRRFYNRAVERANSIVVLDGITHSRNAFLEFVRHFNDCTARSERMQRA